MKKFLDRLQAFFFAPRDARGFGLMRILWGATTLAYLLMLWIDVVDFFSDAGTLPRTLEYVVVRWQFRFSLLDSVGHPAAVFALYLLLLALVALAMVGWKTRYTVIASTLLLYSFHERNPLPLAGGDTVLRLIGFILMISPGIAAISLDRAKEQWHHWKKTRQLLSPLQMPSWPYRLLLWQFIIIYGTSLWYKSLGTMWYAGTAVVTVLHHPHFTRLPHEVMDFAAPFSMVIGYATVAWHAAWLLLLIPRGTMKRAGFSWDTVKRYVLLGGVAFHGAIFLLLRAGSFSWTMFTGYAGLLDEHDLAALKRLVNNGTPRKVVVLYDGRCGLCLRSVFVLEMLNGLNRLQFVNFWNRHAKNGVARSVTESQLNLALHIKQRGKFYKGFDAFRELAWHLPATWLIAPLLYFPGVSKIGDQVYAKIATRRMRCVHKNCSI